MIYGLLIVLITTIQPRGVIGIIENIINKFSKKEKGGEGKIEANS